MTLRVRNIQLRLIDKGETIDKKFGKEQYKKLIEIIKESGLVLIHEGGDGYHIKVPKTKAEIEIFPRHRDVGIIGFVHIQLWNYDFYDKNTNEKYRKKENNFKTLYEALNEIRAIIKDIKIDVKTKKTLEKAYGEDYVENVVNNR